MVVIMTVLCLIWLLLMIKINDSKMRKTIKGLFQEDSN